MYEQNARRILNELLQAAGHRPTSEDEWLLVASSDDLHERMSESPAPEEDFAADAVPFVLGLRHAEGRADKRHTHRTTTVPAEELTPPDWWEAESKRRLDGLTLERADMRMCGGILVIDSKPREPADRFPDIVRRTILPKMVAIGGVQDIAPLIESAGARHMEWLNEMNPHWCDGIIRDPEADPDGQVGYRYEDVWDIIHYPAVTWEQDRQTKRMLFPPVGMGEGDRTSPYLDKLHRLSRRVADTLGITQAECLVWGLTDMPYTIPWLPTKVGHVWTRKSEWESVTIQVNSLSTTAQAVARAYTSARSGIDQRRPLRRAPREWPTRVVAFVDKRRQEVPDETWREMFAAFAAKYPDQRYKNVRTFADAYRLRKKGGLPRKPRDDKETQ